MKKGLVLFVLLSFKAAVADQSNIDITLNRCLNQADTTLALMQCQDAATQKWDKEMNTQYSALMKKLSGQPREKLRAAQRAWMKYREAWLAASRSQLNTQGTLGPVALAAQSTALVRNQTLQLQSLANGSCANPDDC
ncbi:lysozyme inhibitor LprI family protein [Pantoea ananatis]|uniref:lysozyme inhibitor LprI family protein n=1 Tax=Pantoea ananas TaxID=553 RepID=UPI0007DAE383|nr:lysozyme inhibitor LprI family protein [Pantoea ananatis]